LVWADKQSLTIFPRVSREWYKEKLDCSRSDFYFKIIGEVPEDKWRDTFLGWDRVPSEGEFECSVGKVRNEALGEWLK
jgi:hypothetical protein